MPFRGNRGTPTAAPAKKRSKKWLAFGGAAVALVLIVAVLAITLLPAGSGPVYALYLKDGEIVYTDLSGEPQEITGDLTGNNSSTPGVYRSNYVMRSDGSTLFYADRFDDSYTFTLYSRNVKNPDQDPVKIDSDVNDFVLSDDGKWVTYFKDSSLYQYDVSAGEKEKVASDYASIHFSDDYKDLFFINDSNALYWKSPGKDKEKVDSDVGRVVRVLPDGKTAIYVNEEEELCKRTVGEDRIVIAQNVNNVVWTYDSGALYYLCSETEERVAMDYVTDDLAESDAAITAPKRPSAPSRADYDTNEAYSDAYDTYSEEYHAYREAYKQYSASQDRDQLRSRLNSEKITQTIHTLYYYDGKTVTAVAKGCLSDSTAFSADRAIGFFKTSSAVVKKVPISEIDSVSDVQDLVDDARDAHVQYFITAGATAEVFEPEGKDTSGFVLTDDGSNLYYFSNINDKRYGDLYRVAVTNGHPQAAELYDEDVCTGTDYSSSLVLLPDGAPVYFKDLNRDQTAGDLYVNGEPAAAEVYMNSCRYDKANKQFLYYTEWNSEKSCGTLNTYRSGAAARIGEDVHDFEVLANGDVVLLSDYSSRQSTGTLYAYKGGNRQKIDEDVTRLLLTNRDLIWISY